LELMESVFGKEFIANMGNVFDDLKAMFGFGGKKKDQGAGQIMSSTELAKAVATALPDIEFTSEELTKAFNDNARLTERVLSLNEQRNKVQQAIADLNAKGQAIPLKLSNQLSLINNDLIVETGKVADILEKIDNNGKQQIKAIDTLASSATKDFKGDVGGGITGLLKGELNFKEFGEGLLTDFSAGALETLAGGITEGIFNKEDGEASGIGGGIESLFKSIGMDGFSLGSGGEEALSTSLIGGSESTPMYVRVVNALGMGGGGAGEGGSTSPLDAITGATEGAGESGTAGDIAVPEVDDAVAQVAGGGVSEEGAEGLKGIFDKFSGGFKGILDGFSGGLGGMFDGLIGGLGGAFEGLMGMLGGGGGGGGGLLSMGMGLLGGFFNDGGMVPGGGPTPVMAHGGEMILNKRQQSNLFGQLQSGQSQGGQQTTQNINITGDISRQTKKEIFGMLPTIATGVNQHNREQNR
jgi:hypothetical protein